LGRVEVESRRDGLRRHTLAETFCGAVDAERETVHTAIDGVVLVTAAVIGEVWGAWRWARTREKCGIPDGQVGPSINVEGLTIASARLVELAAVNPIFEA